LLLSGTLFMPLRVLRAKLTAIKWRLSQAVLRLQSWASGALGLIPRVGAGGRPPPLPNIGPEPFRRGTLSLWWRTLWPLLKLHVHARSRQGNQVQKAGRNENEEPPNAMAATLEKKIKSLECLGLGSFSKASAIVSLGKADNSFLDHRPELRIPSVLYVLWNRR
jgi:hypothetical protein